MLFSVAKTKKQTSIINEKLEKLGTNAFITSNPNDLINLMKNKPNQYRIVYDNNIDLYMICNADDCIHYDILNQAYKSGLYYNMEEFIESLGAFQNYIETGVSGGWDANDNEIDSYLYYMIFDPTGQWEVGDDDYDSIYHFTFGNILTRDCKLEELPKLWNNLQQFKKQINENKKSNKLTVYHGSSNSKLNIKDNSMIFFTTNKEDAKRWANRHILGGKKNKNSYIHTAEITFNKPYIIGDVSVNSEYGQYKDIKDIKEKYDIYTEIFFDDITTYRKELVNKGYDCFIDNIIGNSISYYVIPSELKNNIKWIDVEQINTITESSEPKLNDNFWKWFGNSKCVDKKGNPKVFIHRSDANFDTFDKSKIGQRDVGWYGKGFYFGSAKQKDYIIYGKNIYKCYLKMENPYYYSINHYDTFGYCKKYDELGITTNNESEFIKSYDNLVNTFNKSVDIKKKEEIVKYNGNVYTGTKYILSALGKTFETDPMFDIDEQTAKIQFFNDIFSKYNDKLDEIKRALYKRSDKFSEAIRKMGYDGIICDDEYIVFEPNQIKSIRNNGNWSLTSDNINEEKSFFTDSGIVDTEIAWKYDFKNGQPTTVEAYHMTPHKFTSFKIGKVNAWGEGVYLTSNPTKTSFNAETTKNWYKMRLYATFYKPFIYEEYVSEESINWFITEIKKVLSENDLAKTKINEVKISSEKTLLDTYFNIIFKNFARTSYKKQSSLQVVNNIKHYDNLYKLNVYNKIGFDGMILPFYKAFGESTDKDMETTVWYVCFNTNQIKSYDTNNGNYDITKNDINESVESLYGSNVKLIKGSSDIISWIKNNPNNRIIYDVKNKWYLVSNNIMDDIHTFILEDAINDGLYPEYYEDYEKILNKLGSGEAGLKIFNKAGDRFLCIRTLTNDKLYLMSDGYQKQYNCGEFTIFAVGNDFEKMPIYNKLNPILVEARNGNKLVYDQYNESKNINESVQNNEYIAYHGSPNKFKKFNNNFLGTSTSKYETDDIQSAKLGHFFTTDKEYSNLYGKYRYKCKITLNNPLIYDMSEYIATDEKIVKIINQAKENGNDGVILKNIREYGRQPSTEYIVFNSNQIETINSKNINESFVKNPITHNVECYYSKSADEVKQIVKNLFKDIPVRILYDFKNEVYIFGNANDKIHIQLLEIMNSYGKFRYPSSEEKMYEYMDKYCAMFKIINTDDYKSYSRSDGYKMGIIGKLDTDMYVILRDNTLAIERSSITGKFVPDELAKCKKVPMLSGVKFVNYDIRGTALKSKEQLPQNLVNESQEPKLNDNFWKWFGNSKVVDENGNPLVVYHGTKDNFTTFKQGLGKKYDSGFLGTGFYFTSLKNVAYDYANWKKGVDNPLVMSVYLNIKNPLYIKRDGAGFKVSILKALGIPELNNSLRITKEESDNISKLVQEKGYDGLIAESLEGLVYVVYNSNQIKSVNNNGNWSTTSNNINESVKPHKQEYGILYHGTNSEFSDFKEEYQNGGYLGNGFYFTMSKSMAQSYGENIIEAKLNYNSSFYFDSDVLEDEYVKQMLNTTKADDDKKLNIYNLYRQLLKNNDIYQANSKLFDFIDFYNGDSTKILIECGYDSIDNIERDSEFVVFNSNQIEILNNINETKEPKLNNNFKNWFGNSKVIDENGNPLVCYHGSPNTFEIFDENYFGPNNIKGFWFSNDKKVGEHYKQKNGKLYSCYIRLENPYILKTPNMSDEERLKRTHIFRSDKNPRAKLACEDLKKEGYDGILSKDDDGYIEVVAFYPNQIKSVNNNGNWSTTSNNINESASYGGANWQNSMDALGNVPATIGHNLFMTMFPYHFLSLCPKYSYGDDKFFDDYIESKKPIGIPFLIVDFNFDTKTIEVQDHEGRHRVAAISRRKNGNIVDIPVAILYSKNRYPQIPSIEELRKNWTIVSQKGDREYNVGQFSLYNSFPEASNTNWFNLYESFNKITGKNNNDVYATKNVYDVVKKIKSGNLGQGIRICYDKDKNIFAVGNIDVYTHIDIFEILCKNGYYPETFINKSNPIELSEIGEEYFNNNMSRVLIVKKDIFKTDEDYNYFDSFELGDYEIAWVTKDDDKRDIRGTEFYKLLSKDSPTFLGERVSQLEFYKDVFVCNDVKSLIRYLSKSKDYQRIVYDKNLGIYICGNGYDNIHINLLTKAVIEGWYNSNLITSDEDDEIQDYFTKGLNTKYINTFGFNKNGEDDKIGEDDIIKSIKTKIGVFYVKSNNLPQELLNELNKKSIINEAKLIDSQYGKFVINPTYEQCANIINTKGVELRLLYDPQINVMVLGNANNSLHWDMFLMLWEQGYYPDFGNVQPDINKASSKIQDYYDYKTCQLLLSKDYTEEINPNSDDLNVYSDYIIGEDFITYYRKHNKQMLEGTRFWNNILSHNLYPDLYVA